jgi:hypothetical protein
MKPPTNAVGRDEISNGLSFGHAFWHMDLGYFGRGMLGSWPQADIGIVLWSLSVSAGD